MRDGLSDSSNKQVHVESKPLPAQQRESKLCDKGGDNNLCALSLGDRLPSVHLGRQNRDEKSKQKQLYFDVVSCSDEISNVSQEG